MTKLTETIKGFNQGYDLRRLKPDLAKQIYDGFAALPQKSEYQQCYLKGFEEAEKEREKTKRKHLNYRIGKNTPTRDKDRLKSKDQRDIDR